jgi:hypothetical protein
MNSLRSTVLRVLAYHLGRPISTIHPWQELERDLDVTPLEVVLVALEIEGTEDVNIEVAGLESARTVGELVTLFTREVDRAKRTRADLDVA